MSNRKAKPPNRPIVAGHMPPISIPGISNDQTEAATITPEANPNRIFCSRSGISFFIKKTKADPSAVPRKGIIKAIIVAFIETVKYELFNLKDSEFESKSGQIVNENARLSTFGLWSTLCHTI